MHPLGRMQSAHCLGGQAGLDFPTSCTWSMNLSLNLGHLPPWLGGCHKALWHNAGSLVSLQKQEQRGNPRAGSAWTYYKLWLPILPPCQHPVTIQPHHQTPTAPAQPSQQTTTEDGALQSQQRIKRFHSLSSLPAAVSAYCRGSDALWNDSFHCPMPFNNVSRVLDSVLASVLHTEWWVEAV